MRLPFKQLKQLPVSTRSGISLGHVRDVILDTDGQMILQYIVKHSPIGGTSYLISRDQIVGITDKAITVDDTVQNRSAAMESPKKSKSLRPEPIAMRKEI